MVIIPVLSDIDVFKARRAGKELARDLGFLHNACCMIEIVVSELASNILRHAGRGTISVKALEGGLEVVSKDEGPGLGNAEGKTTKTLNGPQRQKGLGIGLAGVKRMMDELVICSGEGGGGNTIVARKWLNNAPAIAAVKQGGTVRLCGLMKYGVVSTPALGAESNGDAYVIREWGRNVLLAVIDGLGHGQAACAAATEAAGYILENHTAGLSLILEGCHRALLRTRGAAIGIMRINLDAGKIIFAGVGNVSARIRGNTVLTPVSSAGIVGYNFKRAVEEQYPYQAGDVIVMHSDGIPGGFDTGGIQGGSDTGASLDGLQTLAVDIVRQFGKNCDDNTIIVGKEA